MRVIIEGARTEGKSTLAAVIARILKEQTSYVVSISDGESNVTVNNLAYIEASQLSPRNVDIEVNNQSEEVWDGKVIIDKAQEEFHARMRKARNG